MIARRAAAALPVAALVVLPGLASNRPYPEAPPPAHTGGFGEPTCHTCHFGAELNSPGGQLLLLGLPDAFEPGRSYRLTVQIQRPGMVRAGYQLAVRFADGPHAGLQAGKLRALDTRSTFTPAGVPVVTFAHHTREGTEPTAPEASAWQVEWQAPESRLPVVFHLAANAANGDASEFGDHVYARAYALVRAESGR